MRITPTILKTTVTLKSTARITNINQPYQPHRRRMLCFATRKCAIFQEVNISLAEDAGRYPSPAIGG
ncbi:hypothetical protein KCP78_25705 [Salmonella enterica subsp. enterica]|nr:hypothetical protein KCP78_25705 [Salmonella enterica subsp. enterica]